MTRGGRTWRPLFLAGLVGALLSSTPGRSQEGPVTDPSRAYNLAATAIARENWDEGLKVVNGIIESYGDQGKETFGPVFGHFFYLRGLLHVGKENYDEAIQAFRQCYENYSNEEIGKREAGRQQEARPNLFRYAALVQWANVLMQRGQYGEAATRYEQALEEGDDDPKVNRIYVTVNLGRCRIRAGDPEGGFELISPALTNPRASEGLKRIIFLILSEDWTPQVELPAVREFLEEFRSIVNREDLEDRHEMSTRFRALAAEAFRNDEPIRALAWYSLVVDPLELAPELEDEIGSLEQREVAEELREKKEKVLGELRAEREQLTRDSWDLLNGVGSAHFQLRNFSAGYAAFSRLSDEVPADFENRPVFLHNAVTSAVRIDKWPEAYRYGRTFLDDYPDHELMPAVARVLVEVIFLRGAYQEAYDIATEVRTDMDPGSSIRDVPDFVTGASAYHLEKFEIAEEELDAYLETYPEGERLEPATFYAGLTKVKRYEWEEAAAILGRFIETYPDSRMLAATLYQCGLSEFMLDETEPALAKVERVIADFPGSEVLAKSWNLKGDILATEGATFEEVEHCYLRGKSVADETPGQEEDAAYALWQLTIQTSGVEQWDEAAAHIEEFERRHPDSAYRLDQLVASLPAMVADGRRPGAASRGRDPLRRSAAVRRAGRDVRPLSRFPGDPLPARGGAGRAGLAGGAGRAQTRPRGMAPHRERPHAFPATRHGGESRAAQPRVLPAQRRLRPRPPQQLRHRPVGAMER